MPRKVKSKKHPQLNALFMEEIEIIVDGHIRQMPVAEAIVRKVQTLALNGNRRAHAIYLKIQKHTGAIAMSSAEAPDPNRAIMANAMLAAEIAKLEAQIAAWDAAAESEP